jgi:hypothetical protein
MHPPALPSFRRGFFVFKAPKLLLRLSLTLAFASTTIVAQSQESQRSKFPVGAEQITEGRVLGTLSFLACDEMGGRGTGTNEFSIAAAYVASRFRGAGLVPLGDNDTYYHETIRSQVMLPSKYSIWDADKLGVEPIGLLAASDKPFKFEGSVPMIDLTNLDEVSSLSGVVQGTFETTAKGGRALSQLNRLAQKLESLGATALLLRSNAASEWTLLARQMKDKPRVDSRNPVNIPIILVPDSQTLADPISIDVPATTIVQQPMRNVIGVLRGSEPVLADEAIVYTAHLDHLGTMSHDGDNIYNGADDDASGVTAVLTLADAFAAANPKPKRSLVFMTFWGEESGLLGSKAYVARPSWPLDKITANVNIEMIGRPEDGARGKIWMTGWSESNLGSLMHEAAKPWGTDVFEHPKLSAMLYRASDNWSFVERGVIAHSFSGGSLHADYHKPDDEWERLEIPHMTQVIRGLFVGSLPMAAGEATPKKVP